MTHRLFCSVVAIAAALILAAAEHAPVRADLVGWWDFDDNVDDHSPMGNDGILEGARYDANVPPAIGQGKSLSFELDADHVEIPADPSLDSDVFTLALFFFDRGQEGAFERFTSREGDTFETAINVHPPFGGMGELSYYSPDVGWQWGDDIPALETWQHLAYVSDGLEISIYLDGQLVHGPDPWSVQPSGYMRIGDRWNDVEGFDGLIDDVALWDEALDASDIQAIARTGVNGFLHGANPLQPGDADMDLDFDQLDLVQVQIAGKYLTGQPATWGEGDWNGAPGGEPGNPPTGDGIFNQLDIIAAVGAGLYLTGPYGAIRPGGLEQDGQTSVGYDAGSGEVWVDAPAGVELTSINIDSAQGIFTGDPAENLGGSFDHDADDNLFKATFGDSFGSIRFGAVAQPGLSEATLLDDLTVIGSRAGGGDLGQVDLIYVPEPAGILLAVLGWIAVVIIGWRRS